MELYFDMRMRFFEIISPTITLVVALVGQGTVYSIKTVKKKKE